MLSRSEIDILSHHVKENTQNLLKLFASTPEPVVFFLAGCLPGEAVLHQKQLTLFGMICRLPGNILHTIAHNILTLAKQTEKSWFSQVRSLCYVYNLPHPLRLLREPPPKEQYKRLVKNNIADYWQSKLRAHSATLSSLKFFKPQFMSLQRPHPMWSSAATSYHVNKCVVTARMLSGRYRCGSLLRHFSPACSGLCELCGEEQEDLAHILLPRCSLLQERKEFLVQFARDRLAIFPSAITIFERRLLSPETDNFLQFLLDPSAVPEMIIATQSQPEILSSVFRVTTTWCYAMHRTRLKLLGKWT